MDNDTEVLLSDKLAISVLRTNKALRKKMQLAIIDHMHSLGSY